MMAQVCAPMPPTPDPDGWVLVWAWPSSGAFAGIMKVIWGMEDFSVSFTLPSK